MAAPANPLTRDKFSALMARLGVAFAAGDKIAVAVSGGGDSIALALLLKEHFKDNGLSLIALTVDHDLRSESADEAAQVARWMAEVAVPHHTLKWTGKKPQTHIQELAREARYRLMADYCRKNSIKYLCLAHHADDQAETILFRLAKGSGVDGLGGMRSVTAYDENLTLLRPLLSVRHDDLITYNMEHRQEWVEDSSNQNIRYARVRIRNSFDILEREGLTVGRLCRLADRLQAASEIILEATENEYKNNLLFVNTERIEIKYGGLVLCHIEIIAKIIIKAILHFHAGKNYPVRLEDTERLAARLKQDAGFRGATLAGCIFRKKKNVLLVMREAGH